MEPEHLHFKSRQSPINLDQNTDYSQSLVPSFPIEIINEDICINEDGIDLMNSNFLIYPEKQLAQEIKQHLRNSSYDNVIVDNTMDIFSNSDNQIKITLEDLDNNICEVNTEDEDDNDINSISSQEELDGLENGNSFQDVSRGHLKVPGMGSTDSGVPSTPIMRSPR